MAAMHIDQN